MPFYCEYAKTRIIPARAGFTQFPFASGEK